MYSCGLLLDIAMQKSNLGDFFFLIFLWKYQLSVQWHQKRSRIQGIIWKRSGNKMATLHHCMLNHKEPVF